MDKKFRDVWEEARITYSIAIIEKMVLSTNQDIFHSQIPMEANGMLSKELSNSYIVQRAWSEIPTASVSNILIQVRSRLLDFVLELSSEFFNIESDKEIKETVGKLDASNLFNNAIFGDNATILLGSENIQKVTNSIVKNDFDSLAVTLQQNGVHESDVALLKDAINSDQSFSIVEKDKFGPSVKSWMESILSKVINASWQIELGVAGSLLATALNNYYGLVA
ncbi:response regulator receiver protein [Psychrobacter sp. PAMC 21119]|uniref:AbiTii domain-containing protein n=1 Tax=Psychrobacter sp. PAMC 21119 TaxID=1112209 RepID=UPI001300BF31|nr:response regulator receiver protein [Psychrobacter sp. PAMC 21119]